VAAAGTISVIVPTRDKLPRLRLMLAALSRVEPPAGVGLEMELVIVDDGSTDGTAEWLDGRRGGAAAVLGALPCRVIRERGVGRSGARNRGVQEARGEILLFLDDDMLVTAGHVRAHAEAHLGRRDVVARGPILELPWLRHLEDPARPARAQAQATPRVASLALDGDAIRARGPGPFAARPRPSWLERAVQEQARQGTVPSWACCGANLSVHRAAFEGVGGFDPELGRTWGLEDLELGLRLEIAGATFRQVDGAVAYHMSHHRPSAAAEHAVAMDHVVRKHGPRAAALAALFRAR
jgi:GT2 family glycosyltransferase